MPEQDMKCRVSGQYGKDDNKELHFYCEFCGKEMAYDEDRVCSASQDMKLGEAFYKEFAISATPKQENKDVEKFLYERFWELHFLADIADWWLSKLADFHKRDREDTEDIRYKAIMELYSGIASAYASTETTPKTQGSSADYTRGWNEGQENIIEVFNKLKYNLLTKHTK